MERMSMFGAEDGSPRASLREGGRSRGGRWDREVGAMGGSCWVEEKEPAEPAMKNSRVKQQCYTN